MTEKDISFLRDLAEQILMYCAQASIDNRELLARIERDRKAFLLLKGGDNKGVENIKVVNSNKGEEELIKLKYGQGSIARKERLRKKDGGVTVYYEGRYYDVYGKVKSVYAKTQQECLKLLREANPRKKGKTKNFMPTVGEWLLSWYKSFKIESLRDSTKRSYENFIKIIIDGLGKIKLNDLNGETLQAFFNGIEFDNTKHKVLQFLNACLEKAVVLQKIKFNPCKVVELPKYKKQKRRAFTYEEQEIIMSSAPEKLAQAFFFLCVTGLRVGEFLALTKEDFFFEEHFFKVDKAIADGKQGETKTESSKRIVYFTDELFEFFDISLLGTFTYSGLRIALDRFNKAHGIKGVSLHSTRHTFSTVCHSFGITDKVLQSLMGHATLAMTQDTYTHLLKKGTSKIHSYIEKLCTHIRSTV